MSAVLVTAILSRNRSRYGLQARVTPMRFRGGSRTTRRRGALYGLQRYYVDGREVLYLLTFVLPRFLEQTFEEKLTTVFHELYHMSPAFDGDIRRHPGRYAAHTHSKCEYDALMQKCAKEYLENHEQPEIVDFLRRSFRDYQQSHGGVRAIVVPQPRLVPISYVPPVMTGG
jgi:predicted metallopeptidase